MGIVQLYCKLPIAYVHNVFANAQQTDGGESGHGCALIINRHLSLQVLKVREYWHGCRT